MSDTYSLKSLAGILAGAGFVALTQIMPIADPKAGHIFATRCFALSIPSLAAYSLRGYNPKLGSRYLDILWHLLGFSGFVAAVVGVGGLFAAIDSTSVWWFSVVTGLLALSLLRRYTAIRSARVRSRNA